MEHKLLQGGEIYLPFARSRIKALRATGLAYASQKFDMGDATVRVRIEPGHEYIEIGGEGRSAIVVTLIGPLTNGAEGSLSGITDAELDALKKMSESQLVGLIGNTYEQIKQERSRSSTTTDTLVCYRGKSKVYSSVDAEEITTHITKRWDVLWRPGGAWLDMTSNISNNARTRSIKGERVMDVLPIGTELAVALVTAASVRAETVDPIWTHVPGELTYSTSVLLWGSEQKTTKQVLNVSWGHYIPQKYTTTGGIIGYPLSTDGRNLYYRMTDPTDFIHLLVAGQYASNINSPLWAANGGAVPGNWLGDYAAGHISLLAAPVETPAPYATLKWGHPPARAANLPPYTYLEVTRYGSLRQGREYISCSEAFEAGSYHYIKSGGGSLLNRYAGQLYAPRWAAGHHAVSATKAIKYVAPHTYEVLIGKTPALDRILKKTDVRELSGIKGHAKFVDAITASLLPPGLGPAVNMSSGATLPGGSGVQRVVVDIFMDQAVR